MANKVKQYRFYKDDSNDNQPLNNNNKISIRSLTNGSVFSSAIPIIQLGVQTLPGTEMYINNCAEPIIVGSTGIYELDSSVGASITALRFSYKSLVTINDNDTAYLIIDTVYEEGE